MRATINTKILYKANDQKFSELIDNELWSEVTHIDIGDANKNIKKVKT